MEFVLIIFFLLCSAGAAYCAGEAEKTYEDNFEKSEMTQETIAYEQPRKAIQLYDLKKIS